MKLLTTLIATVIFTASLVAQPSGQSNGMQTASSLQWYTDYQTAEGVAKKQQKPMLLYFTGSDWCGWCKKMDQEIFASPDFISDAGDKFVFVDLDFPMNKKLPQNETEQNARLKQRYGVTGYPTIIILDANGGFIGQTGYRAGGGKAFATYLQTFLQ